MMKKIIAVAMTIMMLVSSMALCVSADYTYSDYSKLQQELVQKYPYYYSYITSGIYSTTKVKCSTCAKEDYTHNMLWCNLCSKWYCGDDVVGHMSSVHNFVTRKCAVDNCTNATNLMYCQYCSDYYCTDHYLGMGHMFHNGSGTSGVYCSEHKQAYTTCSQCNISYCKLCNPYHELSHAIGGGSSYYECAIGGCTETKNLTFCNTCSRWFCANHYASEGHSSHNTYNYAKYCSEHGRYQVVCTKCGISYCPQCINHECDTTAKCPIHGTAYTKCSDCGVSYCANCGYHICLKKDLCSKHNTPYVTCSSCNIKYCPYCTYHTCAYSFTCPTHNIPYVTCGICGVKYCTSCTTHNCYYNQYCSIHGNAYAVTCGICGVKYCSKCSNHTCNYYYNQYCPTHKTVYITCSKCNIKYCPYCTNHVCSGTQYCSLHGAYYTTCATCGTSYCPKCTIHNCSYYNTSIFYPMASVPSGNVVNGTKVTFAESSSYRIFYTLDGTVPTVNSTEYKDEPIVINRDMIIKAIALNKSTYSVSPVVTYTYKVTTGISYTDTSSIKGLDTELYKLVNAGVFKDSTKFNPNDGFTYSELKSALTALGVDMTKIKLDSKYYSEKGDMTYSEFLYVTYKALKGNNIISNAKQGTKTLKTLTYNSEIPKASIVKASYAALVEKGLCYRIDFKPSAACTRAFMAMALGEAYDIINK